MPGPFQKEAPSIRLRREELERDAVAGQNVPQFVRAGRLLLADDVHRWAAARGAVAGPLFKQFANSEMKPPVPSSVRRWQICVDDSEGYRAQH